MARKSGSTISQEELHPLPEEYAGPQPDLDDARILDLDAEQESPFLRVQRRVSVRRGALPKKTATGLVWMALALCVAMVCVAGVASLYHYGEHSWRFRVESGDDIEVTGLQNVTRSQVMEVMGGDIGRNIFFVPLTLRKAQLEQIPWVQSASVMRFVPNYLMVQISERIPVAFARIGSRIFLIDGGGTLMDLPANKKKYSFPVILGMNAGESASTRKARMKIYNELINQLDAGGAHYSQALSEVNLSDLDDVKVLANDADGDVLVHLGSSDYLSRYKIYVAHIKEWRQQFNKVESVDLRYDGQIVVNPDSEGAVRQATISNSAALKAIAAGIKPAAFISRESVTPKTSPTIHSAPTVAPGIQDDQQRKDAHKKVIRPAHRRATRRSRWAAKSRPPNSSKTQASSPTSVDSKPQSDQTVAKASSAQPVNTAAKKKPSPDILKEPEQ